MKSNAASEAAPGASRSCSSAPTAPRSRINFFDKDRHHPATQTFRIKTLRVLQGAAMTELVLVLTVALLMTTMAELFIDHFFVCANADAAVIVAPRGTIDRDYAHDDVDSGERVAEQDALMLLAAGSKKRRAAHQHYLDATSHPHQATSVRVQCKRHGIHLSWMFYCTVTILVISVLLVLEVLVRAWCLGPTVFFHTGTDSPGWSAWMSFNTFDVMVLCCTVLLSLFALFDIPFLHTPENRFAKWAFSVCRWCRVAAVLYTFRRIRGQKHFTADECNYVEEALKIFEERMTPGVITMESVEIIINTDKQKRLFQEKKRTMTPRGDKVQLDEQILFFGTSDTDPDTILDDEVGLDFRFSQPGKLGRALYGAVNPLYSDSAFAYSHDELGGMRKMIVYLGLVGESLDFGHEDAASDVDGNKIQRSRLIRNPKGYDSVSGGPWLAHEYTDGCQVLGLEVRDVRSQVYAFYDNLQVLPLAVITYTYSENTREQEVLKDKGFTSFRNLALQQEAKKMKAATTGWTETCMFEEAASTEDFQKLARAACKSAYRQQVSAC